MPADLTCRRVRPARSRRARSCALLALAATGALLTACGGNDTSAATAPSSDAPAAGRSTASLPATSAPVAVVAVENFWGDITAQIGGDHVKVTSILKDPNADPHSYENDPTDAAAISNAKFVVENGLGYDDFADKLLGATKDTGREVITISNVAKVSGDNPNPHLWYSPDYVKAAATAIADQLGKTDPADAATFQTNLTTFLAAYQPYIDTLATIKSKYDGAKVAYTERVPGYLLDAAGLTLGTPASFAQSIEDGNDPSPADTDAMDKAMKGKTVKLLFYNAQVTSPITEKVQTLAKSSGVPVVGVSETIPTAEKDFQTWQTDQAKAVLAALGG